MKDFGIRIGYASDLHLEFGELKEPIPALDVLILAGDIFLADDIGGFKSARIDKLLDATAHIKHVLYIPGNHEYYHHFWDSARELLREFCFDNEWTWMDNEQVTIDGVHFVGSTLWSDIDDKAGSMMSDYRVISYGEGRLTPADTRRFHNEAVFFLENNIREGSIVLTHHLPSFQSIDEKFKYSGEGVNSAYASHLDPMIERLKPAAWIHGHSHSPKDYMIGNTRIVSNPRGYWGHEHIADNFEVKVL